MLARLLFQDVADPWVVVERTAAARFRAAMAMDRRLGRLVAGDKGGMGGDEVEAEERGWMEERREFRC
jgi:hypothetical protein